MRGRVSAFILACTLAAVAGCSMQDAPERGQKCPPVGTSGKMDCVYRAKAGECITQTEGLFTEEFQLQFCPKEFPQCVKDYKQQDDSYYCMNLSVYFIQFL